jgi:STELLO glycosyltransferase-like protein
MPQQLAIVVTSIAAPNAVLHALATGARERQHHLYVIGDVSSPHNFTLEGCEFFSLTRQRHLGFRTTELCPQRHYARKNVGYLEAIRTGTDVIVETDDDNMPLAAFWAVRQRRQQVPIVVHRGWTNVYTWFTGAHIWPRGLPLDAIQCAIPAWETLGEQEADCPIQQGLAQDNPDVDAIYRLVLPLPQRFRSDRRIALGAETWCPFNSQNTSWWPDAFPLLYLPAYCSFRMTDIWRSFVAQRIAWCNGWSVLFHEATVSQDRNEHSLIRDFAQEIPGYLHNRTIGEALDRLSLASGVAHIPDNLRLCYEELVRIAVIDRKELALLEAWLADLQHMPQPSRDNGTQWIDR